MARKPKSLAAAARIVHDKASEAPESPQDERKSQPKAQPPKKEIVRSEANTGVSRKGRGRTRKSQGFERTSTGYKGADGIERKARRFYFTEAQFNELMRQAVEAGYGRNVSGYLADRLALDG